MSRYSILCLVVLCKITYILNSSFIKIIKVNSHFEGVKRGLVRGGVRDLHWMFHNSVAGSNEKESMVFFEVCFKFHLLIPVPIF